MSDQAHPWFKDIAWEKLYDTEAAFKPTINGELDTQNFMRFDEVFFNADVDLIPSNLFLPVFYVFGIQTAFTN